MEKNMYRKIKKNRKNVNKKKNRKKPSRIFLEKKIAVWVGAATYLGQLTWRDALSSVTGASLLTDTWALCPPGL